MKSYFKAAWGVGDGEEADLMAGGGDYRHLRATCGAEGSARSG